MFTATFVAAAACCAALKVFSSHSALASTAGRSDGAFKAFQRNYLLIFWLMNGVDWLISPYLYLIYKHYGLSMDNISWLSVVAFMSSAILGTLAGTLCDKYGRKKMCIFYSIASTISALCCMKNDLNYLIAGRIFGGISASLLFSVFESWMVTEHFARGYSEKELSSTFSTAVFGNGIVAVAASLYANEITDVTGSVFAPVWSSMAPSIVGAALLWRTWNENYGETRKKSTKEKTSIGLPVYLVGAIQICFESSLFGFVFLFSPVLDTLAAQSKTTLPFGVIMATFMTFSMIGSIFYAMSNANNVKSELIAVPTFAGAALSFFVASKSQTLSTTFHAFNVFEVTIGLFFSMISTLRTRYIPEEIRGKLSALFRLPLNLMVVGILLYVPYATESTLLFFCGILCSISLVAAILLLWIASTSTSVGQTKEVGEDALTRKSGECKKRGANREKYKTTVQPDSEDADVDSDSLNSSSKPTGTAKRRNHTKA